MRKSLIDILAEPGTGAPLRLVDGSGPEDRIDTGSLESTVTGRRYAIVRGIPRFVPPSGYADSFGLQWNKFRAVQVDSDRKNDHSRRRFEAETGWSQSTLEGRRVLDAGCGAGRFAEIAAERGARLVCIDISSAVDATAATLARFDHVDVVQGSILEPPFRRGAFDFAYSIGVIQHTPDPARAVREVVGCVRQGGQFALTIYGRRPWTKLHGKYLIRPLTKRMPPAMLLGAIERAMPVAFPLTDLLFRVPIVGLVARFVVPVANYVERDDLTRAQRYEEAVLDTFDMLSPAYDSPMTASEVERELRAAGATSWTFTRRVPVECRGTR